MADQRVTSFYGSLTAIYQNSFGVHVEAVNDHIGDEGLRGVGGHVYVRDDNVGLFGFTNGQSKIDLAAFNGFPALSNIEVDTSGLEAEAYLGPVTVALQVGRISSELLELDDESYTSIDLYWQINNNWQWLVAGRDIADETFTLAEINHSSQLRVGWLTVYVGVTGGDFRSQYLGVEYGLPTQGRNQWSIIAEVNTGEDDYNAVFVGVHYDFAAVEKAPIISLFDRVTGRF